MLLVSPKAVDAGRVLEFPAQINQTGGCEIASSTLERDSSLALYRSQPCVGN